MWDMRKTESVEDTERKSVKASTAVLFFFFFFFCALLVFSFMPCYSSYLNRNQMSDLLPLLMPSFSFRLIAFSIHFPLTLSFLSPQLWLSKIAQAFLMSVTNEKDR